MPELTARPDLLDNLRPEGIHRDALAYLVEDIPAPRELSIATGYVNLGGLHHLATILDGGRRTRLMLGAQPEPGLGGDLPRLSFNHQLDALRGERDLSRFPPSRAAERLQAVGAWLEDPDVEVRRYTTRFLHGKAYLFGDAADPRAALVSSANLTSAGLVSNLELGLVDYNPGPSGRAIEWFDALWEDAAPFKDELRELLFPAVGLVTASDVYLRALLELYGEELDAGTPPPEVSAIRLASFQRDGYERARRIVARHGGVVYADGVGTGKTEIGLAFIDEVALQGGRLALVVCPAQLKKGWQDRIDAARLPARVLSFQELASDEQLVPNARQRRRHLSSDKDAYRLVVVDEAHAFRNEDTTWYRAMERMLGGERKQTVLLTATPVNNGLWDLYNLVMLFARHDRAFASVGIPSARDLFVRAGAGERDPENLDPDVLFPLADAVSVRRDRLFIERSYPGETFPDGTPVRFPEPRLETRRYDLDEAHPGLFGEITGAIEELTMARYRPSAYLLHGEEDSAEAQLGGLLQSGILKRFESCWAACLATVGRMIRAHDAFLAAWDGGRGNVPSKAALADAARVEAGDAGLAEWVADAVAGDPESLPASDFDPVYGDLVEGDRSRLLAIEARLRELGAASDPKLRLLRELLEDSPATKVAVFATYGETVEYLDEHLPPLIGGRERITVIGGATTPDERTALLARFSPRTVVRPDYVPPEGEADLLLSTDVLSEGQNLQQAQAVVSYDMPWNPQRVVQRNGRVIRLLSPHDEVFLTTMLPEAGDLEELLRLEATVRAKIRAAGVFGMESEVIEGMELELRSYAERLASGEVDPVGTDAEEELGGAFLGEQLRAELLRAHAEGEIDRIAALPWGIGAVIRPPSGRRRAGVFFAARTKAMPGAESGHRYWRFLDEGDDALLTSNLEMLRRIEPAGAAELGVGEAGGTLERAWARAAADIVEEHNRRADPRAARESIGPAQRFALDLLRDPSVVVPAGADEVADALAVERSSAVRRELNAVRAELTEERISRNEAASRVVSLVRGLGLRAVEAGVLPEEIDEDDLGVVCWMVVLPGS
jgi:superfamily II DNA or RNA helicase